jgi:drug/metabolite transporter (DMT)-like permease
MRPMSLTSIYLMALASNLLFSTTSLIFSHYSTRFSPMWMNQTKVLLATFAFGLTAFFFPSQQPFDFSTLSYLTLSGILGLCLGDFLLFKAYTKLGAARSLILFSFQPLILGIFAYFALDQPMQRRMEYQNLSN